MEAISGCITQILIAIFFIWFVVVHPNVVNGLASAMASVFNLIVLLITQIINTIGK
jgi:hypothetical protein